MPIQRTGAPRPLAPHNELLRCFDFRKPGRRQLDLRHVNLRALRDQPRDPPCRRPLVPLRIGPRRQSVSASPRLTVCMSRAAASAIARLPIARARRKRAYGWPWDVPNACSHRHLYRRDTERLRALNLPTVPMGTNLPVGVTRPPGTGSSDPGHAQTAPAARRRHWWAFGASSWPEQDTQTAMQWSGLNGFS
jgi:hypothetical protein